MKVKLWASCTFVGTKDEEIVEVPDDMTDDDLNNMAQDFMNDSIVPEWGFKRITEDEE